MRTNNHKRRNEMSRYHQQVKALLLGVCLHSRPNQNGTLIKDEAREDRLTSAADRLTIDPTRLTPSTIKEMLNNGEDLLEWLAKHPKAKIDIGYWNIRIESDDISDVDWGIHNTPFSMYGAAESFTKTREGERWFCEWVLC
jgi:hypothetical protein